MLSSAGELFLYSSDGVLSVGEQVSLCSSHGMLSASFISTTLAEKLPGPGTIYLKQELIFHKPVRIGDEITTQVEVIAKNEEKKRVTLKTTCFNQNQSVVLSGEALIMLTQ